MKYTKEEINKIVNLRGCREEILDIFNLFGFLSLLECGIHYICQHSFDILPQIIKDNIYGFNEFDLGMLFSLERRGKRAEFIVKNTDIRKGFMLDRKEIDQYGDSFVFWIKVRREIGEMRII